MYVSKPQEILDFIAPGRLKYEGYGNAGDKPISPLTISKYTYTNQNGRHYAHFIIGHSVYEKQDDLRFIDTIRGGSNSVRIGKLNSLRQIKIL